MMIDTHAHLDDEQFAKILDDVLHRAVGAGVTNIITVGTTLASSIQSIQLAERFDRVVAAVGIQPNYCAQAAATDWDAILALAGHNRVVALGETGLDRYWDFTPLAVQQDYFDRHLRLAQQMDLPVVVHMRDGEDDIVQMLQQARRRGPLRGVMHSFTGTAATARCCLDMGMHVSFAGMVTYKKSRVLREIAGEIPADRILIETDAPYLSPHPHRGHRPNEPAMITHTAACLAAVRGIDLALFVRQTSENARQLFRLPVVD